MTNPNSARRTPEQWHTIIDDFSASPLSGAAFCKQHQIQYASFSKWRIKLLSSAKTVQPTRQTSSSFIDLASLTDQNTQDTMTWHITLKLGNGVELVLSQA